MVCHTSYLLFFNLTTSTFTSIISRVWSFPYYRNILYSKVSNRFYTRLFYFVSWFSTHGLTPPSINCSFYFTTPNLCKITFKLAWEISTFPIGMDLEEARQGGVDCVEGALDIPIVSTICGSVCTYLCYHFWYPDYSLSLAILSPKYLSIHIKFLS